MANALSNPIVNSPYLESKRHFNADERGLTDEILEQRRRSAHYMLVPRAKKPKKALKADISEDAWEELYSTVSRPFPKPATGKIAVKVINHYGDEVMKVVEL